MQNLISKLSTPLISLILMMLGSGFYTTFVSIRLELEGHSPSGIGAVVSSLYLGLLFGSIWIDRLITYLGHSKAFILFGVLFSLFTITQMFWIDIFFWGVMRFLSGICLGGVFIVIESWFLIVSGPKDRAFSLSIYLAALYASVSLGQFLIDFSNPKGAYPFYISSLLLISSVIPALFKKIELIGTNQSSKISLKELIKISPVGVFGCIFSGIILSTIYGLIPVYAKLIGLTISETALLMALIVSGGFIFQLPLGKLADRTNRKRVLHFIAVLASLFALFIASFPAQNLTLRYIISFLFGGFTFTLYPLSMASACEKVKEEELVSLTGGLVLVYGFGAVIGPLIAPVSMSILGPNGLFYYLSLVSILITFARR